MSLDASGLPLFCGGGRTSTVTAGARQRPASEPAATIAGKGTAWWEPSIAYAGVELVNNTSAHAARRDAALPAPTMYFGARVNKMWWEVASPD